MALVVVEVIYQTASLSGPLVLCIRLGWCACVYCARSIQRGLIDFGYRQQMVDLLSLLRLP